MAKNIQLTVQKREVTGRKVKHLRSKGVIPGNIYGADVTSQAVSFDELAFRDVFKEAGETHIVNLTVDGEKSVRPTLIYQVQQDPISRQLLHVDFRQVNLKEKITAVIPLELMGESEAEDKGAVILTLKNELEVEALPTDLPETLEVDISKLKEVGNVLTVADIKVDADKVKILLESDEVLVKAEEPKEEEVVEPEPEAVEEGAEEVVAEEEGKEVKEGVKEEKKEE